VHLIGNSLNGRYPAELIRNADLEKLQQIDLAVAYATQMDEIFKLATEVDVPLTLYTLIDGRFPHTRSMRRFIESARLSWRLYLTRDYFHPKIMWFRGIGAYIGSANLTEKRGSETSSAASGSHARSWKRATGLRSSRRSSPPSTSAAARRHQRTSRHSSASASFETT
jgi:hypothetical protein